MDWRFLVRGTSLIWENIASVEDAKKILLGVPLDSSVTGYPGSRLGPDRIREEFRWLANSYDPSLGELKPEEVYDAGNVEVIPGDMKASLERVYQVAKGLVEENPKAKLIVLGGEHSITQSVVRALLDSGKDFDYLCFDAHWDLLDSFLGLKESHASVNKRISELLGLEGMEIIGPRTGEEEEWELARKLGKARDPVYISIDLDVLEGVPVGTPVPGGMSFSELWEKIRSRKWVAADIVEYNPMLGTSPVPSELLKRFILL